MGTTPTDNVLPLQQSNDLPTLMGRYDLNQKCDSADQTIQQIG